MLLKRLSRNGKLGSHSWESWRRRSHSELQIKCDEPTPKLDLQKASHGAEMILGVGVRFFCFDGFHFRWQGTTCLTVCGILSNPVTCQNCQPGRQARLKGPSRAAKDVAVGNDCIQDHF